MMRRGCLRMFVPAVLCSVATGVLTPSCESLNDERIPPYSVNLIFSDIASWLTYGTPAALDYRRFILSERVPSNYPWRIGETTGFGGVLLVGDLNGAPRAYDLACPVECRANVRIVVDTDTYTAYCPKCHSTYDIFTNYGQPLSGDAARLHYALRQYYVGAGSASEYMVIRNY